MSLKWLVSHVHSANLFRPFLGRVYCNYLNCYLYFIIIGKYGKTDSLWFLKTLFLSDCEEVDYILKVLEKKEIESLNLPKCSKESKIVFNTTFRLVLLL